MTKDNVILIAALIMILALMAAPERSAPQGAPGVTSTPQRSDSGVGSDITSNATSQTEPRLDTITVDGATWELIDEVRVCTPDEAYRIAYGVLEPLPPNTTVTLETGERCRYQPR